MAVEAVVELHTIHGTCWWSTFQGTVDDVDVIMIAWYLNVNMSDEGGEFVVLFPTTRMQSCPMYLAIRSALPMWVDEVFSASILARTLSETSREISRSTSYTGIYIKMSLTNSGPLVYWTGQRKIRAAVAVSCYCPSFDVVFRLECTSSCP